MPVARYDNHEDAERDLWLDSSDPRLGREICKVWSFAECFSEPAPRGVTRIHIGDPERQRS